MPVVVDLDAPAARAPGRPRLTPRSWPPRPIVFGKMTWASMPHSSMTSRRAFGVVRARRAISSIVQWCSAMSALSFLPSRADDAARAGAARSAAPSITHIALRRRSPRRAAPGPCSAAGARLGEEVGRLATSGSRRRRRTSRRAETTSGSSWFLLVAVSERWARAARPGTVCRDPRTAPSACRAAARSRRCGPSPACRRRSGRPGARGSAMPRLPADSFSSVHAAADGPASWSPMFDCRTPSVPPMILVSPAAWSLNLPVAIARPIRREPSPDTRLSAWASPMSSRVAACRRDGHAGAPRARSAVPPPPPYPKPPTETPGGGVGRVVIEEMPKLFS